jgi:ring-1,2-phenylacetyl-CoA epoxidase subunit PaaE
MLKFHRLRIAEIRPETADAVTLVFEVPEELRETYRFTQGQHLTLRAEIDGEEVRRTYSICSAVGEDALRVAIKKVEGGRFSSFANADLRAGQSLEVMAPSGRFFTALDPAKAKTYVAFAAGSGITPILSILKTVLAQEPQSRFLLFYGNKTISSILFRDELDGLKNRYLDRLSVHHVLSRKSQEIALFNGRLDAEKVAELYRGLCPVDGVDEFFVCGPGTMIQDAIATLTGLGVPQERIHFELFATADAARRLASRPLAHGRVEGKGKRSEITVTLDGMRSDFALAYGDRSIIDAAIESGIDLPYSCKGGMCCTCRAKLVEGKVDMATNYGLEPWELEAGFVLTCQSRPLTDRVVLDFDAT